MKQWMFPLVLAGLLTACSGTPKPADEPTTGPAAQEAVQQEEVVKEDPIDIYVRNNAERLANFAMRFANASDLPKEIKAALDDEAFKKNKTFLQPEDLKSVYEGRQYAPIFVSNGAISDDFKPLTDEFGQLERHGLKPATGLFEAIEGPTAAFLISTPQTDTRSQGRCDEQRGGARPDFGSCSRREYVAAPV